MAAKVRVEGSSFSVSKQVAQLMVRRQSHEWVIKNVRIKMRPREEELVDIREVRPATNAGYIPKFLPPFELPHLKFKDSEASLRNRETSQVARYHWIGNSTLRGQDLDA